MRPRAEDLLRVRLLVLAGVLLAGGARAAPAIEQLIEARDLVCEFYNASDWADAAARFALRERSDLLLVIENIREDPDSARVVHTRSPGSRSLRRYSGEAGVHFVEDLQGSVVVTTLLACEGWKSRRGREVCVRYSAAHAWHFDAGVHRDPDAAFRRLGPGLRGACEPWNSD